MGNDPPEIQQQNAWKLVWATLLKHKPNITNDCRKRGMSGLDVAIEEIKRLQALDVPPPVHVCHYNKQDGCYYTVCGREFYLDRGKELPDYCSFCGGVVEEVIENACCNNENRNMNGGCDNCGDPCL